MKYAIGIGVLIVGIGVVVFMSGPGASPESPDLQPTADTNANDDGQQDTDAGAESLAADVPVPAEPSTDATGNDTSMGYGRDDADSSSSGTSTAWGSPTFNDVPDGEPGVRPDPTGTDLDEPATGRSGFDALPALPGETERREMTRTGRERPVSDREREETTESADSASDYVSDLLENLRSHSAETVADEPDETTEPETAANSEPAAAPKTHKIEAGDTFSALAQKYYGHAKYTYLIMQANPDVDPRRLFVGKEIKIPALPEGARSTTASGGTTNAARTSSGAEPITSGRTYKVQPGETWSDLGKKFYGDAMRYVELYEFNKERVPRDPDLLTAGTVIEIPPNADMPSSTSDAQ